MFVLPRIEISKGIIRQLNNTNGKVKLSSLVEPPEPLIIHVSSPAALSKNFLENIQKHNLCFQMTPFWATNIVSNKGLSVFYIIVCFFFLNRIINLNQHSQCKDKFTTNSVHFFQHQIKIWSFCKFISQEIKKKKKLINVALLSTEQDVKLFQICYIYFTNIIIWLNYSKLPWVECHHSCHSHTLQSHYKSR